EEGTKLLETHARESRTARAQTPVDDSGNLGWPNRASWYVKLSPLLLVMPAVQDIIQLTIQGQQDADVWGPKIVTSLEAYGIVSALLLSSISEDTIAAVTSNACEGTAAEEIDQKKHNVKTVIKGAATEAANQLRLLHERSLTEERGRAKKLAVDLPAL
ncbi:hypothetical protein FOZ62_015781, partial [Perkinsus olseni]